MPFFARCKKKNLWCWVCMWSFISKYPRYFYIAC